MSHAGSFACRCPVCRVMDNRRLRPGGAAAPAAPWGGGDGSRLRALMAQLLERSGGNALHVLNWLLEARPAFTQ